MSDRLLEPADDVRLPVPAGLGRGLVLASVFVCAACGLVYELELVALASYLAGDSVTHASVVLSVMVFAMGIGSLLAKRLRCRAATGFVLVEAVLAVVGGGSAMALYASFAWLGGAWTALVGFSLAIGVLIGAEMPLLMTLIQRIRRQDAGGALADLFAADYVGALVGGLLFPFLLLPFFGQLTGALLTGVVNASAGGVVVLWLFRHDVGVRMRWGLLAVNGAVIVLLVAGTAFVGVFEREARRAVYGEDLRVAVRTGTQEAVLTGDADPTAHRRGGKPLQLFLDGRLRVCSADGYRYHSALVGPAMAGGPNARVLLLGGGDGLALREVLRHEGVEKVTVLEADPGVVRLARTDPGLRGLNDGAFDDPRVRVRGGDAFLRLREHAHGAGSGPAAYDVVVTDLPAPGQGVDAKLYSQEFYGLVRRALAPQGRFAVHAGAAAAHPETYWTVEATLRSAGLRTSPYAVSAPRDWGFVLARRSPGGDARLPRPRAVSSRTGAADPPLLRAPRGRVDGLPPSTLTRPRYG
ncbi:polyamine aminopropyltransferase 2 [Streptomyces daqingensis]|uniref:Polyamine aminopropyltransferase n=1 Tax=Streptomyces daqingensis TaxID=1472640 RepID=A0ABQ2MQ32_9ACTN|nr:polyamine aminopropyltransferase [Streptomyces daqingensis]GGO56440.1 polyamine aminopropyltransferase 2 [Streptomyces daqingensis]